MSHDQKPEYFYHLTNNDINSQISHAQFKRHNPKMIRIKQRLGFHSIHNIHENCIVERGAIIRKGFAPALEYISM